MFDQDLYPITVDLAALRPGDVIYLGALIPLTIRSCGDGFGTIVVTGRVPAGHPLHGEGSEVTIELERDHRVVAYRPLGLVLDEARGRADKAIEIAREGGSHE